MITRDYNVTSPKRRRAGDLTTYQLAALAAAWGLIFVLTITAMVRS